MKRVIVAAIAALTVMGCSPPESKSEPSLAITSQNIAGAWQCEYKLTDIKSKVHVAYGQNGEFSGRVFLNYPVTTGKGAVKVELVTGGSWRLDGTTLTEHFEVLSMATANSNGNELSEPLAESLREYQQLTTEVIALSATSMTLKEVAGEQTQCTRRAS
ncbi:hypothetical protein [Vibrio maritimus]|uniref:hypothetical protein n=1 Tax=Vibrio maritimus TaxID=990268 RepID=UPI003734F489